ncbi:MAG: hypothetical protein IIY33_07420 [Erysipelotrichaceae bacterium]|nr:hypothetical protein [Erysipelotrichaceae bacterium]
MDLKDILALINAGYTKAEISAMTAPQEPALNPDPTIQPEPEAVPVAEQPAVVPADNNADLSALLAEVKQLRAAVQANALRSDSLPSLTKEDIATKILGEVINPTKK